MSDTTNTELLDPPATPAPPAEQPEGAAPEGGEQPRDEQGRFKAPDEAQARFDRRLGSMRAQLSQATRRAEEMAARLAQLEQRQANPGGQPQPDAQLEALIEQRAAEKAQAELVKQRARDFHAAGAARYPDWQQRCNDLQSMGADAGIALLLVEMPDGARIAGALRDDPEEIERIAAIDSERGRAIALGQYAARLEATPTRQISRAPKPPAPLPGRSSPAPNPYMMDADALVKLWTKELMDAQRKK